MRYHRIPDETVRRMPFYLRGVRILSEQGRSSICSKSLADCLGISDWQIRKDFSYFGDFGKPGVGYDSAKLEKRISKILNLGCGHKVALVGVGNLGSAILAFNGFGQYGFNIVAAFDCDAKKISKKRGPVIIEDVSKIAKLKKRRVDIGIIAVPASMAQEVADALVAVGVKGLLNFAPVRINVPKKIKVITIDIAIELARLPYYMASSQSQSAWE
ncbi:MAG: redox-sensing transcriptional repressor Rex [Planctomycetota bacterium]